jgi:hypothetical protein
VEAEVEGVEITLPLLTVEMVDQVEALVVEYPVFLQEVEILLQ